MTAPAIDVIDSLAEVRALDWDTLVNAAGGNVFLSHAYLHALHETGCASPRTGWTPRFLVARAASGRLCGALPLYLKAHSYGEYVFDWSWAEAWQRAGGDYYPKLLAAVPFTPCAGPRLLATDDGIRRALVDAALALARRLQVSSLHVLFPPSDEAALWRGAGLMLRQGVQFHWQNHGYTRFDDLLASMTHDKRKRIRQDRRYVADAGVRWRIARGASIRGDDWAFFYDCYQRTYAAHHSSPYLSAPFFERVGHEMGDAAVLFVGERADEPICASLCIASGDTVYGRYWGTREPLKSLHFEACYYQPIAWCIAHGYRRFEGGAQGAHKLARGLLPVTTHSAHWVADRRFADAVAAFLARERAGVAHTLDELTESSPFKTALQPHTMNAPSPTGGEESAAMTLKP
ncbi:MAG: N-acetyltransferase [Burkholderiales bacterium]|nr:N-acetyltransferase [Burkholderiales bacterium]